MSQHSYRQNRSNVELVSNNLLRFFVQKLTINEYLDSVVDELGKWTGCRCIGVRVRDSEGYIPYVSFKGFGPRFLERESRLSLKSDRCACIRVIMGKSDLSEKSLMTDNGSFHFLNLELFVTGLSEEQRRLYRRGCLEAGFKTVCVIPIRYRNKILGAIHLADEREAMVSREEIETIESTALLIGEAILRYTLENDLADSEKQYKSLIENSLCGIYLVQNGKIIFANEAFADIHGYERHEILGIDSLKAVHPEDQYMVEEFRRKRQQGEKSPNEYVIRGIRKNGDLIWVHRRNVLIEYGGDSAILGYEIDITSQKKSEITLKENQELLETIFSNVHFLVAYMDSNFNFIRVNRAYAEADDKSPDFFIGKNHFSLYPDEKNELIFREVVETGDPYFVYAKPFEYAAHPERGTTFWDWSLMPVKDTDGNVNGVVLSLVNVTDRKRAEEALKTANEELVQRTADLERSNRDLQEFAFVASHDLREPLRKMFTFGNMLMDRCGTSLDEVSRDYLTRIQSGAKRMKDLLDSLLAYAHVTSSAKTKQEIDLRESVKSALSNLEILIQDKNAVIEIDDLPTVTADQTQMIQLFQNLIGNALKFQLRENRPHIKVYTQTGYAGSTAIICVEDNGIGFKEDAIKKIFSPFQRLHGRSTYEGAGMGLAICRKITERHGGKITAKSQPGKGSTFIITLPSS